MGIGDSHRRWRNYRHVSRLERIRIRRIADYGLALSRAVIPPLDLDHPILQTRIVEARSSPNHSGVSESVGKTSAWRDIVVIPKICLPIVADAKVCYELLRHLEIPLDEGRCFNLVVDKQRIAAIDSECLRRTGRVCVQVRKRKVPQECILRKRLAPDEIRRHPRSPGEFRPRL